MGGNILLTGNLNQRTRTIRRNRKVTMVVLHQNDIGAADIPIIAAMIPMAINASGTGAA
jgi:hypothetical protein